MAQVAAKSALDSVDEIATLRIELVDSDPLIWRAVEVPTSITLKVLHDVVQAAMGWFDSHLWEFTIGKRRYGRPLGGAGWGAEPVANAAKVCLSEVLKPRETVIAYIYDFGDSWEHRLTITDVRAGAPDVGYPRYVAGAQAAPPEDCGGLPGFYDMLDALADPQHPDHDEVSDWFEGYDPQAFDERPIAKALGRIARRRNAARKRASAAQTNAAADARPEAVSPAHDAIGELNTEAGQNQPELPITDVDIEALDAYLASGRAPPDCMMLSELDGFLAGLAVGPEDIAPGEWLPRAWGGEEPAFANDAEARAVRGAIMGRYAEIGRQVAEGTYCPIYRVAADDLVVADAWAVGFARALTLRAEAWGPLFKAKHDSAFTLPILVLCGGKKRWPEFGLDAEAANEIVAAAPDVLPACVMGIANFWRRRRSRHGHRKPARNAPCPCGSGRKYKNCCGRGG